MKIAEYLIYFFGTLFVLNWFGLWFVFPYFEEISVKISAILFVVLAIINFILASILARGVKENENKE